MEATFSLENNAEDVWRGIKNAYMEMAEQFTFPDTMICRVSGETNQPRHSSIRSERHA